MRKCNSMTDELLEIHLIPRGSYATKLTKLTEDQKAEHLKDVRRSQNQRALEKAKTNPKRKLTMMAAMQRHRDKKKKQKVSLKFPVG